MTINELYHHGIIGQKWGVRRYQNKDGSLTLAGKNRYKTVSGKPAKPSTRVAIDKEIDDNIKNNNLEIKKIIGPHSRMRDLGIVNNGNDTIGRKRNCVMCSIAYEMRRKGINVKANETTLGRAPGDIMKTFNIGGNKYRNYYQTVKQLDNSPSKSRGIIVAGCGSEDVLHSVNWEKIGNSIKIFDPQKNIYYDSIESSIINKESESPYYVFRTDDISMGSINFTMLRDSCLSND